MESKDDKSIHEILIENCKKVASYTFDLLDQNNKITKLSGSKMQIKTGDENGKSYKFNI